MIVSLRAETVSLRQVAAANALGKYLDLAAAAAEVTTANASFASSEECWRLHKRVFLWDLLL